MLHSLYYIAVVVDGEEVDVIRYTTHRWCLDVSSSPSWCDCLHDACLLLRTVWYGYWRSGRTLTWKMALESLIPKFRFSRILNSNANSKSVALLGTVEGHGEDQAILLLEKSLFNLSSFDSLSSQIDQVLTSAENDIYQWGTGTLYSDVQQSPDIKISLIFPATETHIKKHETQQFHMVEETPELYRKLVVPYINSMKGDRLQWVRNILFDGAEAERVVFKSEGEEGFVILPDLKWDEVNIEQLYLVLIVNREDIASIRDLNSSHIEYLTALRERALNAVSMKYSIAKDQLRLFVHYQPSYYHFHIHIVNVQHSGLGGGVSAGKAILLEDIIDQLQWLGEEGFEKRTLTYSLGENTKLWALLKDAI